MHIPRTAGVRAKVSTTLFAVSRDDLRSLLDDHPHMRKYMTLIAQRRRLRVAFLNPDNEMTTLGPENMKDEEVKKCGLSHESLTSTVSHQPPRPPSLSHTHVPLLILQLVVFITDHCFSAALSLSHTWIHCDVLFRTRGLRTLPKRSPCRRRSSWCKMRPPGSASRWISVLTTAA